MGLKEIFALDENKRCVDSYEKIKKQNALLNNIITFVDPTKQLQDTKKGKLFKIPYVLKDNISTKNILTTAASDILDNYIPVYDATVYKKLQEEGAVLIAKTSMDELAMGGTNKNANIGPCHNPYNLNCISGGSSGGSCVAVACNQVSFAIGTDTGDSIRKPASFCGVVGVKPSYGRISRYGVIPYASSLDHVGYFTQNVEDAALLLEVLAGRDDKDMTSSFKEVQPYRDLLNGDVRGKKVLVFKNVIDSMKRYPNTLKLFNDVIDGLRKKGALIEEVSFDEELLKCLFPVYYIIANCEATANHSNLDGVRFGHQVEGKDTVELMTKTRTRGFGTFVKKRFLVGSYGLFEENQELIFKKAQKVRRLIVEAINSKLKDADCLIAPASTKGAPFIDDASDDDYLNDEYLIAENHMVIGNFAGLPSMTVPMGFDDEMPIGINVTSNAFDEVGMFNVAKAIEEITGLKNLVKEEIK